MNEIIKKIAADLDLVRKGTRYQGACPDCGGNPKTTSRFQIHDDGGYKCWACGITGDVITWLRDREGMSCPEAFDAIGRSCNRPGCPVWGTCRHGDGTGRGGRRLPARVKSSSKSCPALASTESTPPENIWLTWACGLVDICAAALPENKQLLQWLSARGISAADAVTRRLGWHAESENIDRASIGLPPVKNGKKTLWVPRGLVIPVFDRSGRLHRLRIRRPAPDCKKFAPNLKYVWLDGSGKAPQAIYPADVSKPAAAVIVEADLDGMAVAAAADNVLVVSIGTVRGPIDHDLTDDIAACPVILVALDAESGKDGQIGPGPAAVRTWLAQYRQAKYWPVPMGKDPGEYVQAGGDIAAWITAALPPSVDEQLPMAGLQPIGGQGGDTPPCKVAQNCYEMTLASGENVLLTDDRQVWEQAAESGRVVFTRRELLRIKAAQGELAAGEAELLLQRIIDAKKTFASAYVSRGAGRV